MSSLGRVSLGSLLMTVSRIFKFSTKNEALTNTEVSSQRKQNKSLKGRKRDAPPPSHVLTKDTVQVRLGFNEQSGILFKYLAEEIAIFTVS